MFKKSLCVFLVVLLLTSLLCSFSTGAQETDKANTTQIKTITLQAENNTSTYLDENGNEVDINGCIPLRRTKTALPSSYDLRDYGRSTSVKDQEDYGFCWAFASTASMESSILTQGLGNETSDTLDLSETGNAWYLRSNIDDVSSFLFGDYLYDPSMGSSGGIAEYAADSLSNGFGAYPEELISYDDFDKGYPECYRFYSDYRLKEFTQLPYDIDLVKQKIMENGAVYYSYNCFPENSYISDGMETYYDDGTSINGSYPNGSHAVTVIGWDDNFSKDNFHPDCNVQSDGAWLCKNSWGENYQGDVKDEYKGYFWASYESQVNNMSQFVMQDAESFDNVYQHQTTGGMYAYSEAESGFFSAANVYTANSDEKLEQICFSNIYPTEVTTKIYKLNENYTSPVDGELLDEFTTHISFTGTHCLEVPNDIVFKEGDIFSVVIEGDYLTTEFKTEKDYDTESFGKSYISDTENEWTDLADYDGLSYATIKAYTSDLSVDKSELKALVKEAKKLTPDENADDALVAELKSTIRTAKKVLSDKNATSNTVNNTYCLLKGLCEKVSNCTFHINNMDDFLTFYTTNTNCTYVELNTDLDFASTDVMHYCQPINLYGKTFDGNGHTIKNLYIDDDSKNSSALFDCVKNSVIKDLNFDNAYVEGFFVASVLTTEAIDSQFINCHFNNSTVKAIEGMYASLVSGISNNCTFTDCSANNSTSVGGYIATLFTLDDYKNCTFENCTANDYSVVSFGYVCDNMGFEGTYEANNFDPMAALTVTDDNFTIQQLVGEILSLEYNGEQLSPIDGIYTIGKSENSACPYITFGEYDSNGFAYCVDAQAREIRIIGYMCEDTDIVIPDTLFDLPVTNLADTFNCYMMEDSEVTSISIPDSIKNIPSECFASFDNLQNVTLGKGVESIGEFAFGYCVTDDGYTPIENFTIHGYAGTAAESYATDNGFKFVDLTTTE